MANYDYDNLGRLVTLMHFLDTDADLTLDAGEHTLAKFDYTVDDSGNRTQAVETFDDDADGDVDRTNTFTWTYDGLNRLVRETYDGPEGGGSPAPTWDYVAIYSFDLASNRTTLLKGNGNSDPEAFDAEDFDVTTYAYDANDRLQTEVFTPETGTEVTTEYTYNTGGDQTSKTTTPAGGSSTTVNYTYDVMGRMTGVDTNGVSGNEMTYAYDYKGVRVSITQNGVTTNLVIDALNPTGYTQVLEERDGTTGDVSRTYTIGIDVLTQVVEGVGPVIHRQLYDAHGSTRGLVNTAGQTVEHYSYDAYGNLINFTGTPLTSLLYSGEWRDRTTGLDYLRDRWLDPRLGTFPQVDRFRGINAAPLSHHRYLYGNANPIRYVDPTGQLSLVQIFFALTTLTLVSSAIIDVWGPRGGSPTQDEQWKINEARQLIGLVADSNVDFIIKRDFYVEQYGSYSDMDDAFVQRGEPTPSPYDVSWMQYYRIPQTNQAYNGYVVGKLEPTQYAKTTPWPNRAIILNNDPSAPANFFNQDAISRAAILAHEYYHYITPGFGLSQEDEGWAITAGVYEYLGGKHNTSLWEDIMTNSEYYHYPPYKPNIPDLPPFAR